MSGKAQGMATENTGGHSRSWYKLGKFHIGSAPRGLAEGISKRGEQWL